MLYPPFMVGVKITCLKQPSLSWLHELNFVLELLNNKWTSQSAVNVLCLKLKKPL